MLLQGTERENIGGPIPEKQQKKSSGADPEKINLGCRKKYVKYAKKKIPNRKGQNLAKARSSFLRNR